MIPRTSFHTHTVYCDGKHTPEEMVKSAISLGFEALGFSGHAYTPCEPEYSMSPDDTKRYKEEILKLKDKYAGKIDIYCGLELDYYSEADGEGFDFCIGSVHYIEKNGVIYPVDASEELFLKAADAFGGIYGFTKAYYELLSKIVEKTNPDIIGHFDLVTKFNEGERLFSEADPEYTLPAHNAMDILLKENRVFEINTGAMSRGYRKSPYPSSSLTRRLIENGAKIIVTSDCHDAAMLDFGYAEIEKSPDIELIEKSLVSYKEIVK